MMILWKDICFFFVTDQFIRNVIFAEIKHRYRKTKLIQLTEVNLGHSLLTIQIWFKRNFTIALFAILCV